MAILAKRNISYYFSEKTSPFLGRIHKQSVPNLKGVYTYAYSSLYDVTVSSLLL